MQIVVGQSFKETAETFTLNPEGEIWHMCRYPEKPGVWRVRPGKQCETPCEAYPLSGLEGVATPAEVEPAPPVLVHASPLPTYLDVDTLDAALLGSGRPPSRGKQEVYAPPEEQVGIPTALTPRKRK